MIKITPNIQLPQSQVIYPIHPFFKKLDIYRSSPLSEALDMGNSMNDLFPSFNEFLHTGLVPENLIEQFQTDCFGKNTMFLFTLREAYIAEFGFSLLSQPLLNELAEQLMFKKVLEIGAGTGFLAKKLQDLNVNLTAVDVQAHGKSSYGFSHQHTNIIQTNGISYLHKNIQQFDTIILTWPDYNSDFAAQVVKHLKPNQRLYYLGEGYGGCTADDQFFDLIEKKAIYNDLKTNELNKKALSWPFIHDQWKIYDF